MPRPCEVSWARERLTSRPRGRAWLDGLPHGAARAILAAPAIGTTRVDASVAVLAAPHRGEVGSGRRPCTGAPSPVTASSSPPRREELGMDHEQERAPERVGRASLGLRSRLLFVESRCPRVDVKPESRVLPSRSVGLARVAGMGPRVRLARVERTRGAVVWVSDPTHHAHVLDGSNEPRAAAGRPVFVGLEARRLRTASRAQRDRPSPAGPAPPRRTFLRMRAETSVGALPVGA